MFKLISNEDKCRPSSRKLARGQSFRGLPNSKENSFSVFGQNKKSIRDNGRLVTVIPYQFSIHKDSSFSGRQAINRRNSASPLKEVTNSPIRFGKRCDEPRVQRVKMNNHFIASQNTFGSFDNSNGQHYEPERLKKIWSVIRDQNLPIISNNQVPSLIEQYKNLYIGLSSEALKFRTAWEGYRFSVLQTLDKIQTHIMSLRTEFIASLDRAFMEPNEFIESTLRNVQANCANDSFASPKNNNIEKAMAHVATSAQSIDIPDRYVNVPILKFDTEGIIERINEQLTMLCTLTMEAYSFESINVFNQLQREKLTKMQKASTESSTKAKKSFPRTTTNQTFLDHLKKERSDSTKEAVYFPKDYRQAINMIFKKQKSIQDTKPRFVGSRNTTIENFAGSRSNSQDKKASDISTRPQTGPKLAVQFDDFEFRSIKDIPETISLSVNFHTEAVKVPNDPASNFDDKNSFFEKFDKKTKNMKNPRYQETEEKSKYQTPRGVSTKEVSEGEAKGIQNSTDCFLDSHQEALNHTEQDRGHLRESN